jgi:hypothetical protein
MGKPTDGKPVLLIDEKANEARSFIGWSLGVRPFHT